MRAPDILRASSEPARHCPSARISCSNIFDGDALSVNDIYNTDLKVWTVNSSVSGNPPYSHPARFHNGRPALQTMSRRCAPTATALARAQSPVRLPARRRRGVGDGVKATVPPDRAEPLARLTTAREAAWDRADLARRRKQTSTVESSPALPDLWRHREHLQGVRRASHVQDLAGSEEEGGSSHDRGRGGGRRRRGRLARWYAQIDLYPTIPSACDR